MLNKHFLLTLIPGVILLFSECSSITMMRTKELRAVQSNVDSLRTELVSLQKNMYEEQKSQGELVRLIRADQQLRFGELNRKISEISANLSENQSHLSMMGQKTAAFQKKLEAKLSSDSLAAASRNEEVQRLFQICMSDFNAGRFDIAISGFRDLSTQYGDSPLAAEAEYWVAECNYAKRSYGNAEKEYIAYIKKYPEGDKLCIALYKLGQTYGKQRKNKSKQMVWKKAIEQCPDTPEIQSIKSEIK